MVMCNFHHNFGANINFSSLILNFSGLKITLYIKIDNKVPGTEKPKIKK